METHFPKGLPTDERRGTVDPAAEPVGCPDARYEQLRHAAQFPCESRMTDEQITRTIVMFQTRDRINKLSS
jgi:hypothetical protein